MKWNPALNAIVDLAYIFAVALFIRFIESVRHDTLDTVFDSMNALSLLVFSAAIMAFLFSYQPLALLVENKKTETVRYLLRTHGVLTIALLTLVSIK